MANKIYSLVFTSGDPRTTTVLTPTLVVFARQDTGGAVTAPGITQAIASSGIFQFEYQPTLPLAFIADGGASAPSSTRYLAGNLDPIQLVDFQAVTITALGTSGIALGMTNVALGTTGIATTTAYGNTNVAIGTTLFAIGTTNVALGTSNIALGTSNFALGVSNFALGTTGVALGTSNIALGTTNVALGTSGVALGTTSVAIGTTLTGYGESIYAGTQTLLAFGATGNAFGLSILAVLGTTASSLGSTSTDPGDLFGMLKRLQEFNEGNAVFTKTSGLWEIKTRGSTLFATKTLTNAVTSVTKS